MAKANSNPPRNGEGDCTKCGGGGPGLLRTPIKQVKRSRRLRREMSLPEVILWQALRRRPQGLKFRRQFPIDQITVDFACLERRLAIEIDGEHHGFADHSRRDVARDALLRRLGFTVLRIPARDVLNDADAALRWVVARCSARDPLHHSPLANSPPPRPGED